MNKLKAMAIFVKIVECGSMSAAADKLNMSQSSVVRSLAALEKELKTQLLHRTTRRLKLTEEGHEYYVKCSHILHDISDLENALTLSQTAPKGLIRITAPVTFGRLHIRPIVSEFMREFPDIDIELLFLDRVVDLVEEGMDVALRIGPLPDSTLIAKSVGEVRYQVCASPEFIQEYGEPESPDELQHFKCVQLTALRSHFKWVFQLKGKPHKISIRGKYRTNHIETALDVCKEGIGLGQFLSYQVASSIKNNELVPVLREYEPEPMPVSLVYPHSRLLASRTRTFIDWALPKLQERLCNHLDV